MKPQWDWVSAGAVCLLGLSFVLVQRDDPPAGEKSGRVRRTSALIGRELFDEAGSRLGRLEDFVIDEDRGVIEYGVVSFDGSRRSGDRLVAVPWHDLRPSTRNPEEFVLDVTRDGLEAMPDVDDDESRGLAPPAVKH